MDEESVGVIKYDNRLMFPLDFVCKVLGVKKEDFVSLALANLLDEELDWLEYSSERRVNSEEVNNHQVTVNMVKTDVNSRVIKD